jgi:hypothetical protein
MNPCAVCRRPGNTTLHRTASSLRLRFLALELPRPRQAPAPQRLSSTPQIRGAGSVSCANAPGLGYHVAKFRNSSIVPQLAAGVIRPAAAHGNPNGGLSHASCLVAKFRNPSVASFSERLGGAAQSWEGWLRTPKPTPAYTVTRGDSGGELLPPKVKAVLSTPPQKTGPVALLPWSRASSPSNLRTPCSGLRSLRLHES